MLRSWILIIFSFRIRTSIYQLKNWLKNKDMNPATLDRCSIRGIYCAFRSSPLLRFIYFKAFYTVFDAIFSFNAFPLFTPLLNLNFSYFPSTRSLPGSPQLYLTFFNSFSLIHSLVSDRSRNFLRIPISRKDMCARFLSLEPCRPTADNICCVVVVYHVPNHCSYWTWVVEEILPYGCRLRSLFETMRTRFVIKRGALVR